MCIDAADVELTAAGRESLITRLEEDPRQECRALEEAAVPDEFPGSGQPKPGATVLVDCDSEAAAADSFRC